MPTSNDLTSTLYKLASNVQNAMASLHSLQVASINANRGWNSPPLHDAFLHLRKSLRDNWMSIISCFKKCYAFIDDAILTSTLWEKENADEIINIIQEMMSNAARLHLSFQALRLQSEAIRSQLDRDMAPRFLHFFRCSPPSSSTATSSHIPPSDSLLRKPQRRTSLPPISHAPTGRLQSNVLSPYPDGPAALHALSLALVDTCTALRSISRFCKSTQDTCQHILYTRNQSPNTANDDLQCKLESWKECQNCVLAAISSITRSSDAILVEAVGGPTPQVTRPNASQSPKSHRRNSSKFLEKPLPLPPPLPPKRRRTSSYSDEVPISCWGYKF